ncbi:LicD family protein [Lutispora thermophila]|uniref:Lipopolysaccharide cholinephosphotransferase n=1 Tax=Lutispora thermophila DSM 19022 TaxID=1122184 RepID=A0A1M6BXH8_9FIRM|nr:LicD family protein [Lutispora thermophila]SHI53489.1 lipopolysaccharide cholinephosphotransferase [Lutispora thermophila DSM 19022]
MEDSILRQLQIKELEILLEIDKICKKNNLTYYLIGGSALGAIRHNGFIPWDDDIDIGLPRKDYEAFLNICKTELDSNYFLQTWKTDKNYINEYAKVRLNNTAFVEEGVEERDMHHGIFVDVYPIDGTYKNKIMRYMHKLLYNILCRISGCKINTYSTNKLKGFIKKIVSFIFPFKFIHITIDWVISRVPVSEAQLIGNILGRAGYDKELMPKEYFGIPIEHEFEGYMLPIPNNWDKYLTRLYGDYMQIPPLEKRESHKPVYISFNHEYKPK